jgi:hypothetical protein
MRHSVRREPGASGARLWLVQRLSEITRSPARQRWVQYRCGRSMCALSRRRASGSPRAAGTPARPGRRPPPPRASAPPSSRAATRSWSALVFRRASWQRSGVHFPTTTRTRQEPAPADRTVPHPGARRAVRRLLGHGSQARARAGPLHPLRIHSTPRPARRSRSRATRTARSSATPRVRWLPSRSTPHCGRSPTRVSRATGSTAS